MTANWLETAEVMLPASAGELVGRDDELARACQQLATRAVRLLTVTGVGGIGKTRLALEIAQRSQVSFAHGARFIDLAPVDDPALVPFAISAALDLGQTSNRPPLEALERALHRLDVLLVIDNFEQVLGAAADIAELLRCCPGLSILATSRAPLHISWEHELALGPLDVPSSAQHDALELMAVPAMQLLLERMDRVGLGRAHDADELAALAAICRRLDGVPLALELTAARARALSIGTLVALLERPLDILTVGPRDTPPRHQSLRETFDWSYALLGELDRELFRSLGVFMGGWTLDAAARVFDRLPTSSMEFLDAMNRLIDSSLVRRMDHAGSPETRFALLEPVREYANEQLRAESEADLVRERHALVYLELAERADAELRGPRQAEWLDRLDREQGNVSIALRWFVQRGAVGPSLRLAGALCWFWWARGYIRHGLERVREVLALVDEPTPSRAHVLARARALSGAGVLTYWQGNFTVAETYTRSALELYSSIQEVAGHGFALNMLGNCAFASGDAAAAEPLYEQSLSAFRSVSDQRGVAQATLNLGLVISHMMDLDRAHAMLTESVALEEAAGDTRGLAFALQSLANLECQRGHPEVAEAHLRRSLALWREVGDRAFLPLLLEAFAVQAAASAESARALRLAAVASSLREQMDVLCPPIWLPRLNGWLASARSALGEQAGAEAWQAGLGLSPEAAIAEALEPPRTRPDQPPLPVAARTGLTRRESEVLQLVAGGATNKEIANQLTLSVATVERHIANLYAKIGARGRAEATAFAITRGLVRPPSA